MPLSIEIELEDVDLDRFRAMFAQARAAADNMDEADLVRATRAMVDEAEQKNPPGFIGQRIAGLRKLAAMLEDDAWRLPAEDRAHVTQALAYFVNPDDLIPDKTPGLGFLDDAIAAELALRALAPELDAYEEFCVFREAEAERRANRGLPTDVSKEDWLADRRAVLLSRMRQRRTQEERGWRATLFG